MGRWRLSRKGLSPKGCEAAVRSQPRSLAHRLVSRIVLDADGCVVAGFDGLGASLRFVPEGMPLSFDNPTAVISPSSEENNSSPMPA